jgi:opacity protein-like surface antigen
MVKSLLIIVLFATACRVNAQARATASRVGDVQIGAVYLNGESDYEHFRFNGYGLYADLDLRRHLGVEAEYNFMSDADPITNVSETSYEIGGRYLCHVGRFQPYAKLMVGRGIMNFLYNTGNSGYNMAAVGGGTDIRIRRHINARADFEYQKWFHFPLGGVAGAPSTTSLSPSHVSLGIAYHF